MKAKIVVGLGWGDEGKGLTTDLLCSLSTNPIVVRFNGGQQAGHNVVIGDKSHEHRSFGSGTLRGIPSYLSEHTCFYIPAIMNENKILLDKGCIPNLSIHPLSKMTTPYDVAYNRVRETRLRHGSCGLGIGATFSRHEGPCKVFAVDMSNSRVLQEKLHMVNNYYTDLLAKEGYTEGEVERFKTISFLEMKEMNWALAQYRIPIRPYSYLKEFDTIIFEGCQGIMLDMDIGVFPNVTYSNTTSKNAIAICRHLGVRPEIYYVTRCYQTRHGNGWMQESTPISLINNENETNVTNEWQGAFRTAELDYNLLRYAMSCDNAFSDECDKSLVVTCLDQRPNFDFKESYFPQVKAILKSYSPDCDRMTFSINPSYHAR